MTNEEDTGEQDDNSNKRQFIQPSRLAIHTFGGSSIHNKTKYHYTTKTLPVSILNFLNFLSTIMSFANNQVTTAF